MKLKYFLASSHRSLKDPGQEYLSTYRPHKDLFLHLCYLVAKKLTWQLTEANTTKQTLFVLRT